MERCITCESCGTVMDFDRFDEDEPLEVYKCPYCGAVKFVRVNGYEG